MSRFTINTQQQLTEWLDSKSHFHDGFIKTVTVNSHDVLHDGAQIKTGQFDVVVTVYLQNECCQLHFKNCKGFSFAHETGDDNTIFEVRGTFRGGIGLFFSFNPVSSDPHGDLSGDNDWVICESLEVCQLEIPGTHT